MCEGKIQLRRARPIRDNNIKTDLSETEWKRMDCVHRAKDRDLVVVMKLWTPQTVEDVLTS